MKYNNVRVRFAPSPTGFLHLGGLRTALYNYLFARHNGGVFVLRIEDTDRARTVPGALENILDALHWYGLEWDEGPRNSGQGITDQGPYGPYIQSHRKDLYKKYADMLLNDGHAYRCFCTPARLEQMRTSQMQNKQAPRYDGTCRRLPIEQVEQNLRQGIPFVIRFATPETGATTFTDLVRGTVTFEHSTLDDSVLMKSDGFPTYHLANVVDDHLMKISHVIRAEEWLPSTPKHILLFGAFGWELPTYAHLPMILGSDRAKLSKRHGAEPALEYKHRGYISEAVVNFLALLGWNPGDEREFFSMSELAEHFSLDKVNAAPAIFDSQKLLWMNGKYIRLLPPEQLSQQLRPFLPQNSKLSDVQIVRLAQAVRERITMLSEVGEWAEFIFHYTQPSKQEMIAGGKGSRKTDRASNSALLIKSALEFSLATLHKVSSDDPDATELSFVFDSEMKKAGLTNADILRHLRFIISGSATSPDVFAMMSVLGKKEALSRISYCLGLL